MDQRILVPNGPKLTIPNTVAPLRNQRMICGGANDSGDQLSLVTVSDPACQARIAAQFLQTSGPEVLS